MHFFVYSDYSPSHSFITIFCIHILFYNSGTIATTTSNKIITCSDSGTYLKNPTDSICTLCEPGKYSVYSGSSSGISSCSFCNPGTYQSLSGTSRCNQCDIGSFSVTAGATTCQGCPEGQTTFDSAIDSVRKGMTFCSRCPDGKFWNQSSVEKCIDCLSPGIFFCRDGIRKNCSTPILNQQYISKACDDRNDAVLNNCSSCIPGQQYISSLCTPTTDTICSECTICRPGPPFLQYEFSKCRGQNNTICSVCNSSAGDMVWGTGKCNPCPPGMITRGGLCTICPAGTFSERLNATACATCQAGFISAPGSSRCVKNCTSGYYAPSGDADAPCIPLLKSTGTMMIAASLLLSSEEVTRQMTISAAAQVPLHDDEIAFKYFIVATKKPFAYSSEILLVAGTAATTNKNDNVIAWSVAGNGYYSSNVSDGKGEQASFALITSIALDTSNIVNTENDNNIKRTSSYLITEYDEQAKRGYLRYFTLDITISNKASYDNVVMIQNAESETNLLMHYSDKSNTKILHKIDKWIWPAQAVYDEWQDAFLIMDIGLNSIVQIKLEPLTRIITSCIILISSSYGTDAAMLFFFNPLSFSILQVQNDEDMLFILGEGKVSGIYGYQTAISQSTDFHTNSLTRITLCGGGMKILNLEIGMTLPCSEVDFSSSGAKQVLSATSVETTKDVMIYILLTSPTSPMNSAIAVVKTSRLPPNINDNSIAISKNEVSVLFLTNELTNHEGTVLTSSFSTPLHFISKKSRTYTHEHNDIYFGSLQSLYLVESRGIIKRLGGIYLSSCLCEAGLFCDVSGGTTEQCLDAPLGAYTDGAWTTAPIACPMGMIGQFYVSSRRDGIKNSCIECPIGYTIDTNDEGIRHCRPACENGYTFDTTTNQCALGGCSALKGLYFDTLRGTCMKCWLGSESSGGQGPESCLPCIPGTYGKTAGYCEVCPPGTTTWSYGSTLCMPDILGESNAVITEQQKYCADGIFSEMAFIPLLMTQALKNTACPTTMDSSISVMPIFEIKTDDDQRTASYSYESNSVVTSFTASRNGLLIMIGVNPENQTLSGGSLSSYHQDIYVYDIVNPKIIKTNTTSDPQNTKNKLASWQKLTPSPESTIIINNNNNNNSYERQREKGIFHFLQICETCNHPSLSEYDSFVILYHAAKFGTCVYKTVIDMNYYNYTTNIFKGDCVMQGQAVNGLLPIIHSMTIMETEQLYFPVLYISTLTLNCAEIVSISTYDGTVTILASRDVLKRPIALLNVCFVYPPILTASKGVNGVLYAASNDKVYASQISGPGAFPEIFLSDDTLIFQLNRGTISAITIQNVHHESNNNDNNNNTKIRHHLIIITQNGDVHSVPVSAYTLSSPVKELSTIISTSAQESSSMTPITSAILIGRRLWYVNNVDGKVYQMILSNLRFGCAGGFVIPDTDKSIQGVCLQVGKGSYADFEHGVIQSCPQGTFGIKAGASLRQTDCRACPGGTIAPFPGSAFCNHCPPGLFSNPLNTECVKSCPQGTYRSSSVASAACIPCRAGYSTATTLSSDCIPCSEGMYSNALTFWQCTPCPQGYTSPKGAHSCVRICSQNKEDDTTCAIDGENCVSLTKQYKVLSQIFTSNSGQRMVGLAVDKIGGVFYTNGNNIRYYFDDCPSYSDVCNKEGSDLLPANKYIGYSFSSLAVCDDEGLVLVSTQCGGAAKYVRKLYVASLTYSSIFVLHICQDANGMVNSEATRQGSGLTLLAGANWAGFADGPFTSAAFNQPADLELNDRCTLLYLSDFYNHRIRRLNLTSQIVTTVAGAGFPCWKMGDAVCSGSSSSSCLSSDNTCGSINYPLGIGLSVDENDLYIAANNINSLVKISNVVGTKGGQLVNTCRFAFGNIQSGTLQQCNLNAPNSKGCMLFRAFDVAAVAEHEMYVGVSQGITKIYSEDGGRTFLCQQIAGNFFDVYTTGLRDGISPSSSTSTTTDLNSLVNVPYKMAFARERGVLYFADLMNGAIRRVMVKSACMCPVGTLLLPSSSSCYNPSPTAWSKNTLPICQEEGYYALEGDTKCFRKCSDALRQGLVAAPCLVTPNNPQFNSLSYSQLLGNLFPPQSTLQSDWYGSIPAAASTSFTFAWNSIFQSTDLGSTVSYKQGKVPGRAPGGRNFVSLTYSTENKCWNEETLIFELQPVLVLPGLWFPCQKKKMTDTSTNQCTCPLDVTAFEPIPSSQAEKEARSIAPKRWQALRAAAALGNAMYMDPERMEQCGRNPFDPAPECKIQPKSIFMIFGSPDSTSFASTFCPDTSTNGGPCFPTLLHHVPRQSSSTNTIISSSYTLNINLNENMKWNITELSCYLGWPAHYYCPNGYTWIAPSPQKSSEKTCSPVSELITCLSCLPGTFSYLELKEKQSTGGPYSCTKCHHGTFSSAVGSSTCSACPVGKYSSILGASFCTSCAPGMYTVIPKAYSPSQCVDCLPGTGNCTGCVEGTYQNNGGQIKCLITPPGFYTSESNASAPTPCAPGYYQDTAGQTTCIRCNQPYLFTHGYGATACISCAASNCSMVIDNVCGKGCGLNQYFDNDAFGGGSCVKCPPGTLNAYDSCAMDAEACWQNPRRDYYVSNNNDIISRCPYGSEANSRFDGCNSCDRGYYSDSSSQGCKKCPQGKYAKTANTSACTRCEAGKANPEEGRSTCYDCSPGTFSSPLGSSSQCANCPPGRFSSTYGSVLCEVCPFGRFNTAEKMTECNEICDDSAGFYSLPGDTNCRYCDGGTINISHQCQGCGLGQYISEEGGERICKSCPQGLVNLNVTNADSIVACIPCISPTAYASSSVSCVESALGFVPNSTGNGQRPCPAGTIRTAYMTSCTDCPVGTFNEIEGGEVCSECEPGKYTDIPGQRACFLCSSGSISKEPGAIVCQNCPAGTYASNSINCSICPENTFSSSPKQIVCTPCTQRTFSTSGSTVCSYCPAGKTLNSQRKCDLCSPGKYMTMVNNEIYSCLECRAGKYMPFSSDLSSPLCSTCTSGKVSLLSGASTCTTCPAGFFATNVSASVCEKCQPGKYSPDGLGCVHCPLGTYAPTSGLSTCNPCTMGYFQDAYGQTTCQACKPGTFSNSTGKTSCLSCLTIPNSFNDLHGQSSCIEKLKSCGIGQYIHHSDSPILDHDCVDCLPCAANQLTIILGAFTGGLGNIVLYAQDEITSYSSQVCKGDGEAPLYQCVNNVPRAGEYLSFEMHVGESSSAASSTTNTPYNFKQCENPKYNDKKVMWVAGGDISQCYVACLYGINSVGLLDYIQKYSDFYYHSSQMITQKEDPANNVFLERLLDTHVDAVCMPCPLGPTCPRGKFRPKGEMNPECGPECALPRTPSLCATAEMMNSGCISNCTNAPTNSDYIDGSQVLGSNTCPWICNPGWHLSNDRSKCLPCPLDTTNDNQTAIAAICGSISDYVLVPKDQCLHWHTNIDLCKPCAHLVNGRSIGWDPVTEKCKYQCHAGFFYTADAKQSDNNQSLTPACVPCQNSSVKSCPIGMYLDMEICFIYQLPPACKPCEARPPIAFTSNGGFNASQCKGICPPGFHTVSKKTGLYSASLDMLPFVPDIQCVQCTPTDQRACLQSNTSICFEGYYRNLSVPIGLKGGCIPCKQKEQCPAYSYPLICTGREVVDAPCIPCPESLLKDGEYTTKQFVSYAEIASLYNNNNDNNGLALLQIISGDFCPRVCLNNFARDPLHPDQCISCKSMAFDLQRSIDPSKIASSSVDQGGLKCIQLGTEPPACSFIFSHWNATPAVPWWDVAKSTPWMMKHMVIADTSNSNGMIQRAGQCWPCPGGMITGPNDKDICTVVPGFVSPSQDLPQAVDPIPSLPADVSVVISQTPLFYSNSNLFLPKKKKTVPLGRRLLMTSVMGERKQQGKRRLLINLNISTTAADPGTNNMMMTVHAKPCPYGYYKPTAGEGACFACPQGSSTRSEGSKTKDACMCKYGYYRTTTIIQVATAKGVKKNQTQFLCLPCPAETYNNVSVSVTAASVDSKQQCTPCPPNQTTYGNEGATRCVCALGMIMDHQTGECSVCPVGYYCQPCDNDNINCSSSEVIMMMACYPGSTSPAGSFDIDNCTCIGEGMVRKTRPKNPSQFYCQRIPIGGEINPNTGSIVCKKGWTTMSRAEEDGSVTECSLCPPGYYGSENENGEVVLLLGTSTTTHLPLCTPCPIGTYLPSKYGIGSDSCISCPPMQTTISHGAINLENCSCPSSMAKDPIKGTCIGCSPTQYVDPLNATLCKDCPANAIAQTGATSSTQCMCNAGFYSFFSSSSSVMKCALCPVGTFSSYASSNNNKKECTKCPEGSTTANPGSTRLSSCGENPSLCNSGYSWRMGVGCFKVSS